MKFGGTSLKDAATIRRASAIISDFYKKENPEQLVVVVSAPGKIGHTDLEDKITNLLEKVHRKVKTDENFAEVIKRAEKISKDLGLTHNSVLSSNDLEFINYNPLRDPEEVDRAYSKIVSLGERQQRKTVSDFLESLGLPSKSLDFNEFGMLTDYGYIDAKAAPETTELIEESLKGLEGIIVIPGFVGYNYREEITTLGRDGSNYTATKVAEAIQAREVYIFSDEPGVRRAPPRLVPDAEILEEITYDEAIEFAELGAKIINAKSVYPAKKENIPINIVDENYKGTKITSHISSEHLGAKIIASSPNHFLLTIKYGSDKPGVLADIAEEFKKARVNIESISDERHALTIAFVDSGGEIGRILSSLNKEYQYTLENSFARVSLIGQGMRNQPGILAKMTSAFARRGISIDAISQSLNQLNITTFIPQEYERTAVRTLYDDLFR